MADSQLRAQRKWYKRKSALMEAILGKEHRISSHAIIPYAVGGSLDLYYYPYGISGTAVATKELSELPGEGSWNLVFECYELVMFTKHAANLANDSDPDTVSEQTYAILRTILNRIARYSENAILNPKNTCEFPANIAKVGGRCLIFDGYPSASTRKMTEFGLLLIIEVFRSEMEYARENGGAKLLKLLKAKKHYPYSDMDRQPVA